MLSSAHTRKHNHPNFETSYSFLGGSSSKATDPGGMSIMASLHHIWIASFRLNPSKQPPLTLNVSAFHSYLCTSLLPHLLQNKHSKFLPDAVCRMYSLMALGWGDFTSKGGKIAEIPKAEEDWCRHSEQWQTKTFSGAGRGVRNLIAPHWHLAFMANYSVIASSYWRCWWIAASDISGKMFLLDVVFNSETDG